MSVVRHTPGPWTVTPENLDVVGPDGDPVLDAVGDDDVAIADLHLAAAAPELLEVVEELFNWANLNILFRPELRETINEACWDKARKVYDCALMRPEQ